MANDQLTTTLGAGAQTTTQSPQAAPSTPNVGNQAPSKLQTSAASNLQGGVQINGASLGNITLNVPGSTNKAQASTAPPLPAVVQHHHPNPLLFGVSGLLLVIAAVLFWATARAAKNTTDYS